MSDIHFHNVSYIADTTKLLLGLIFTCCIWKFQGILGGYDSDEYMCNIYMKSNN